MSHLDSLRRFRPQLEMLEDRTVPATLTQITGTFVGTSFVPALDADGTRIAFASNSPQLGINTDGNNEIFLFDTTTGQLAQITNSIGGFGSTNPSIDGNGRVIAFQSSANPLGLNNDGNFEIFFFDTATGQLAQLTNTIVGNNIQPSISDDGRHVAFASSSFGDGNSEIFIGDTSTGQLTQITNTTIGNNAEPSLNADGTTLAFVSDSPQLGAAGFFDVFLFNIDSNQLAQVTNITTNGNAFLPSISDDGTRVAFHSNSTEVGQNPDGSSEVFVFDGTLPQLTQITNTVGGQSVFASIDGAGNRVAFASDSVQLGQNGDGNLEIFQFDTATSALVQITNTSVGASTTPAISGAGNHIAFASDSAQLEQNFDGNGEIFLFDNTPTPPPPPPTGNFFVAGGSQVNGFTGSGALDFSFNPFPGFPGEVRIARGDVNGDNVIDIIAAAGPGGGPHIKVFDGRDRTEMATFFAFNLAFTGGVFVDATDVNRDGFDDIIVGAGENGGPHVKVFSGQNNTITLHDFFAFNAAFTGGVRVAGGDTNGDGFGDIIVGAGPGGGPHVKVFDGTNSSVELASFFAFETTFQGGVFVAVGDFDNNSVADIIVGAGPGRAPSVRAFSGLNPGGGPFVDFFAFSPSFGGGVRVTTFDADGNGRDEIVTGAGRGGGPHVIIFDTQNLGDPVANFFAFDPFFNGGVFVA